MHLNNTMVNNNEKNVKMYNQKPVRLNLIRDN